VIKDLDISYGMVTFNGSLLKENVFRQGAGPEVDAAWTFLGVDCKYSHLKYGSRLADLLYFIIDRAAVVPSNIASKSGLLPSQVQVSEKYGGGFPANVEGLHHLHCLVNVPEARSKSLV